MHERISDKRLICIAVIFCLLTSHLVHYDFLKKRIYLLIVLQNCDYLIVVGLFCD